ncbi:SDR family oxidoreductase [Chitinophaga sp. RCC_12]|uniref:SDR family oxidoreductase n=1 Tax=Chitinophaga sp. RCC_12 TaxID=3239226 RepID=UPI003524681E
MKTTGNTVLITGGSAGIGLEIARQLSQQGNQVIITGRDAARLEKATQQLPGVKGIVSDVTSDEAVTQLAATLHKEYPSLNILVNNAGRAFAYELSDNADAAGKAVEEMDTNFFSVIRLTEKLLPLLSQQPEAAIVNVTSIVAFAPGVRVPTYSATKAALRSYTQSMRVTFPKLHIFELMPPLVNTDFSQEIGGINGIHPSQVAADLVTALGKNEYEIRVGNTELIYQLSLSNPAAALAAVNGGGE